MKQRTDTVAEIEVSYRPPISNKPVVRSGLDAFIELIEFFPPQTIALLERFLVMYLNRANRVLGVFTVGTGGITETTVDIRLLLSVALKTAATGIVLCHNHPSGRLTASSSDIAITGKIQEACRYFDITVVDHLIISPERKYLSMADHGLM
jgi:DNA repair protein RadC